MRMTLGQRIRLRREELGMSVVELARKAGLKSHGTISQIESSRTGALQGDTLVKIARALHTSAESLLLGLDDPQYRFRLVSARDGKLTTVGTGEIVLIPAISLDANKSHGVRVMSDEVIAVPSEWLIADDISPEKAAFYTADVPALDGLVGPGDQLLIHLGETKPTDGSVYLVQYADALHVRRVYIRPDGGLILKAPSQSHVDMMLSPDDVRHLAVVGRVKRIVTRRGL